MSVFRPRLFSNGALIGALTAFSTAGCLSAPEPDIESPQATGRHGLLVISNTFGDNRARLSGQLMAWKGPGRLAALEALTEPELAWFAELEPAPGECIGVWSDTSEPLPGESIDLLSAGPITATPPAPLDETPVTINPRPFPGVLFSITGLVYDAERSLAMPYLAGGRYTATSPGDEVGPLRGDVTAAEPVWIERLESTPEGLSVHWGGDDAVLVAVTNTEGGRRQGVLCATDGSGEALVPAVALGALADPKVRVTVARVERGALDVAGLDEATLLFIARDSQTITLDSPSPFDADGDPMTSPGLAR